MVLTCEEQPEPETVENHLSNLRMNILAVRKYMLCVEQGLMKIEDWIKAMLKRKD